MADFLVNIGNMAMNVVQSAGNYAGNYMTAGQMAQAAQLVINIGMAYATRPEARKAGPQRSTFNQTMPPRRRLLNRARIATADSMMLKEARNNLYQVGAVCEGPISQYGAYWLHSDRVTVDGDNKVHATEGPPAKYNDRLLLYTRLGLPTETSYYGLGPWGGENMADLPAGTWSNAHRGDGIASVLLVCRPVEQNSYRNVYPHGQPEVSVLPIGKVYDWRKDTTRGGDGAHRLDNPATWEESWNLVLWWAQVEAGPPDRADFVARFERLIAPQLASWTQAADDCDDAIPLAAGGTEARYRLAGWYNADTDLADIRKGIMAACDGFMIEAPGGSLHIQVGKWREPTITIPKGHIKRLRWKRGKRSEAIVNELVVSYLSPDHDWFVVPGTPWKDEASIAARGRKPAPFVADWVPSHGQARRLAKIMMKASQADGVGTVVTTLFGLNVLFAAPPEGGVANRRVLNLERQRANGEIEIVPVEITGSARIDWLSLTVEFPIRRAVPEAYDWSAIEEG